MSTAPRNLIRTLGWMQAVVTHPGGVRAGVASDEARRYLEIAFNDLETVVSPSGSLTAAERLMIYNRSYHARLLDCFREEYPCLSHALGRGLFDQFVVEYLQRYPPRSHTLRDLAGHFPRWLAEARPEADAPPEDREGWPDFMIDLATLERTFAEIHDGPGVEGRPIVTAGRIPDVGQVPGMRLAVVPCLRILAFRYPVASYFHGVRGKENPTWPLPAATRLAVNRRNYVVRFTNLSERQFAFLKSLTDGCFVSQALAETDATLREALVWLRAWADAGFFLEAVDSKLGKEFA